MLKQKVKKMPIYFINLFALLFHAVYKFLPSFLESLKVRGDFLDCLVILYTLNNVLTSLIQVLKLLYLSHHLLFNGLKKFDDKK